MEYLILRLSNIKILLALDNLKNAKLRILKETKEKRAK